MKVSSLPTHYNHDGDVSAVNNRHGLGVQALKSDFGDKVESNTGKYEPTYFRIKQVSSNDLSYCLVSSWVKIC